MNPSEEQQNRAWVALWRETAAVLEEVKARELRALTEEEAGRMFADMAADGALPFEQRSVGRFILAVV